MQYFRCKSTALVGGITKTAEDLLEKLLLANSFLDTFERIIFTGEIAMAALHALDISVGKVERSDDNAADYENIREFMLKLFDKAVEKDCEIVLPFDFITAEKSSLDEIIASNPSRMGVKQPGADPNESGQLPHPETSMSKASIPKQIELSEIQQEELAKRSDVQSKAFSGDIAATFKPQHWSDAQIYYG